MRDLNTQVKDMSQVQSEIITDAEERNADVQVKSH